MLVSFILFCVVVILVIAYLKNQFQLKQNASKLATQEDELKKLQEELTTLQQKLHNAMEDPVTHLLGFELFEDRLNQSLLESERHQLNLAVLSVDIDDFKIINEILGYEAGDQVLEEVGKRLQDSIRKVDSVSRYTKDIFVVLLTRLSKPEAAAIVVHRILQAFSEPLQIKNHSLNISVKIGIATYPTDGGDKASLLRNSDYALHVAKEKSELHYYFYHEKIHAATEREFAITLGLKDDSLFDQLILYYQPVMNIPNKTVFCVEAFLYWQHPKLGLIEQQELFHYAQKQGKTNRLIEWLLKNACQQLLRWRSIGFHYELLSISISTHQLRNTQFIYNISKILQDCQFKPEWLMLKIKNTIHEVSTHELEKTFNMLKYLNVKLAIHDFDSGLFSLFKLKNMSVNYLIMDNAIVCDVEHSEPIQALIQAIVKLIESLSLQLIIENVETEKQASILSKLGCHLMQGKFLGEPMIEKDVAEKMI